MPGTLHVVATPIGNLEDITLRALRVLREVAVIAAEDTRHSRKLLTHHGIETPLVSFHEHNRRARLPWLLERLQAGQDVAVISDAGTPGISDPGVDLVAAAADLGIAIDPVPGASAMVAAAVASGFPLVPLSFLGFCPPRAHERRRWLAEALLIPHTFCFFEAPTRVAATIGQLAELCPTRSLVVARELTKVHQQLVRGTASALTVASFPQRGEFTFVAGPAEEPTRALPQRSDDQVVAMYRQLVAEDGVTRRAAISATARASARSAREVYAIVERAKSSS